MVEHLKILEISDIHIGERSDSKSLWNELEIHFLQKIDESVDMILVGGDIFHKRLSLNSEASRIAIKFIDTLKYHSDNGKVVWIIRGTSGHDYDQLKNFYPLISPTFRIFETVEIIEQTIKGHPLKCLMLPEEYPIDTAEYYKPYFDQGPFDFILGHMMYKFASYSENKGVHGIKSCPVFDERAFKDLVKGFIVCGHIHTYISWKDLIYYGGSWSRERHGEEEPKGALQIIYYPGTGAYDITRIINPDAPMFKTFDLRKLELSPIELTEFIEKEKLSNENIRIMVDDTMDKDIVATYKNTNVKIKPERKPPDASRNVIFDPILDGKFATVEEEIAYFAFHMFGITLQITEIKDIISDIKDI